MKSDNNTLKNGKVVTVLGPVVDVKFDDNYMPKIYEKLLVDREDGNYIALEVLQHVKTGVVRCIALQATEGISRGMRAVTNGRAIEVPVGEEVLGRVLNVLGEPIDNKGEIA